MLRSAFAHIFHGARGVSRPKVHEKRDRDEGTAGVTAQGIGRERRGTPVAVGDGSEGKERERKKRKEAFGFDRLMTNA